MKTLARAVLLSLASTAVLAAEDSTVDRTVWAYLDTSSTGAATLDRPKTEMTADSAAVETTMVQTLSTVSASLSTTLEQRIEMNIERFMNDAAQ